MTAARSSSASAGGRLDRRDLRARSCSCCSRRSACARSASASRTGCTSTRSTTRAPRPSSCRTGATASRPQHLRVHAPPHGQVRHGARHRRSGQRPGHRRGRARRPGRGRRRGGALERRATRPASGTATGCIVATGDRYGLRPARPARSDDDRGPGHGAGASTPARTALRSPTRRRDLRSSTRPRSTAAHRATALGEQPLPSASRRSTGRPVSFTSSPWPTGELIARVDRRRLRSSTRARGRSRRGSSSARRAAVVASETTKQVVVDPSELVDEDQRRRRHSAALLDDDEHGHPRRARRAARPARCRCELHRAGRRGRRPDRDRSRTGCPASASRAATRVRGRRERGDLAARCRRRSTEIDFSRANEPSTGLTLVGGCRRPERVRRDRRELVDGHPGQGRRASEPLSRLRRLDAQRGHRRRLGPGDDHGPRPGHVPGRLGGTPSTSSSRSRIRSSPTLGSVRPARRGARRPARAARARTATTCSRSRAAGTLGHGRHRQQRVRLPPTRRDRGRPPRPCCIYLLARILFLRRSVALIAALLRPRRRHVLRQRADRHERHLRDACSSSRRSRCSCRSGSAVAEPVRPSLGTARWSGCCSGWRSPRSGSARTRSGRSACSSCSARRWAG